MDNREAIRRCAAAPMIKGKRTNYCVVYGRTVRNCKDCAFSTLVRPKYLRKMGITA